jgi:hypothetical protein
MSGFAAGFILMMLACSKYAPLATEISGNPLQRMATYSIEIQRQ